MKKIFLLAVIAAATLVCLRQLGVATHVETIDYTVSRFMSVAGMN